MPLVRGGWWWGACSWLSAWLTLSTGWRPYIRIWALTHVGKAAYVEQA